MITLPWVMSSMALTMVLMCELSVLTGWRMMKVWIQYFGINVLSSSCPPIKWLPIPLMKTTLYPAITRKFRFLWKSYTDNLNQQSQETILTNFCRQAKIWSDVMLRLYNINIFNMFLQMLQDFVTAKKRTFVKIFVVCQKLQPSQRTSSNIRVFS